MEDEKTLISQATKNNWKRLGVNHKDLTNRLSKRANKRFSAKKFIPVEYLSNRNNLAVLEMIIGIQEKLESVIYSLAINLLVAGGVITYENNKISSQNPYIFEIFEEFGNYLPVEKLLKLDLPKNERDFLGVAYQSLLLEGDKNKKGSYYTPKVIVDKVLADVKFDSTFLDPCCGTGSFLLTVAEKITYPENIYGFDLDKVACFISRINLILKYKNKIFRPNIYNADFLLSKCDKTFDIIATNPPWGAVISDKYLENFKNISSGESFSYFLCHCKSFLNTDSFMYFVLPEAILNVKAHNDIRKFILKHFSISEINLIGKAFSGVLTNVVLLKLQTAKASHIYITNEEKRFILNQKFYETNFNNNFSILDDKDVKILQKIYSTPHQNLSNSIWGLGIVTGNNSKFISDNPQNGEKIYSGKNITKNGILESEKYIKYERENFQQIAADEIYRAEEKLVYKFISKKLVFAHDDKQRLFLNSANILIPKLQNLSIEQTKDCLNSTLYQYIYEKQFNELKILKGNLSQLPLPYIDAESAKITDDFLYRYFNLSDSEIAHIINECRA